MSTASGHKFSLKKTGKAGEVEATVLSVAAALVSLKINGIDVVEPGFDVDRTAFLEGVVMAPWVNRLADGRWQDGAVQRQVSISHEPTQVSNHGLMLDTVYKPLSSSDCAITLRGQLSASEGYPFDVIIDVTYELTDNGISVLYEVENVGTRPAPFAIGSHPYLKIDGWNTADLVISSSAQSVVLTDERMLPLETLPVAGSCYDLSQGRRVSDAHLDNAFTDLGFDSAGFAHTYLQAPDGLQLDVWQSRELKHTCIFTPNNFGTEPRWAVAIEPQTAAANAFNTGNDLIWLQPGQVWSASWGISL